MSNRLYRRALEMARHPIEGGYQRPDGEHGFSYWSENGMRTVLTLGAIYERHAEELHIWLDLHEQLRCEHNRPLKDLSWEPNDYAFEPDTEWFKAVFILCGFHEEPFEYCIPWGYQVVGTPWKIAGGMFFEW